jgi:L-fuconolactonase
LEAFGPQRLLYGTDWPVCLAGVSYKNWLATVRSALKDLSKSEQSAIFAGNAKKFYSL